MALTSVGALRINRVNPYMQRLQPSYSTHNAVVTCRMLGTSEESHFAFVYVQAGLLLESHG